MLNVQRDYRRINIRPETKTKARRVLAQGAECVWVAARKAKLLSALHIVSEEAVLQHHKMPSGLRN